MVTWGDRPLYQQLADDLRQRIIDGQLVGGERLPSENHLVAEWGVSRIVVRHALNLLVNEGLLVKHQGKGTFVRNTLGKRLRVQGRLHPAVAASIAGAGLVDSADSEYRSRFIEASQTIASRLGLSPGDRVLRSHYRFFADEVPSALVTCYESEELATRAPAQPGESPGAAELQVRVRVLGLELTHLVEDVEARAARPREIAELALAVGTPIFVITQTYYATRRPMRTADWLIPADRYALGYAVSLS